MKQNILVILLLFLGSFAQAQILKKAKWEAEFSKPEAKVGETVEVIFKANIEKDWYLYSSDFDPDLGPIVTEIIFEKNPNFQLVGKLKPINPKRKYDSLWSGEYTYFKQKAEFRQTIKILKEKIQIKATARYQVCSDVTGQCVNGEDDFNLDKIKIMPSDKPVETAEPKQETESPSENTNLTEKTETQNTKSDSSLPKNQIDSTQNIQKSDNQSIAYEKKPESLTAFLIGAMLWGLAALLTPCVFPMLPMTVSFFTSRSTSRKSAITKALFFGFSIVGIYTVLGTIVSLTMGADFANWLSTHWLPNTLFFAVFVIFALSFFGMFEIVLPSKWANKSDELSEKGGFLGIFFMAFTLAIVSFSCTGPVVGSVLVASAGGEFLKPILGMLAFSIPFALPFVLLAIFPSWLQNLPKSGGWLNSVKVVLGFVELAFAFKFLSVADQTYHWGLLDRHVYIAIWLAISFCAFLYFLGFIRLPHDSKMEKIPVPRLLLALLTLTFIIYLIPGMWGAPLKMLSGYLPPQSTHNFDIQQIIRKEVQNQIGSNPNSNSTNSILPANRKYANFLSLPHGLQGYFDYQEGLEAARKAGKPVFIDFTGHGCVNCRKMEEYVWVNPEVLKRLKEDFVIVSLYVDDKTELPENEWIVSSYDGKTKKTIGAINAEIQIRKFQNNAQPYYCILDHNENLLVAPFDYDPDYTKFVEFLDKGKKAFGGK